MPAALDILNSTTVSATGEEEGVFEGVTPRDVVGVRVGVCVRVEDADDTADIVPTPLRTEVTLRTPLAVTDAVTLFETAAVAVGDSKEVNEVALVRVTEAEFFEERLEEGEPLEEPERREDPETEEEPELLRVGRELV